jgi:hypothetical protein
LKNNATREARKICEYGRHVSVLWSPDSRYFALNDYVGSNIAETFIISVDETVSRVDLQDRILSKYGAVTHGGHEYFGVARWLDVRRVVIHDWGHDDEPPSRDFCVCYVYTLGAYVQKCAHQPRGSDLEEFCARTTP